MPDSLDTRPPLVRWADNAGVSDSGVAREIWLRSKERRLRKFVQDEPPPRLTGARQSSS